MINKTILWILHIYDDGNVARLAIGTSKHAVSFVWQYRSYQDDRPFHHFSIFMR
jgi:hypothetical protein